MNNITIEEKQQFDEQGFIGPLKVLNKRECEGFLKVAYDPYHPPPLDWSKGCAASSRAYYKIAMHPEILERVEGLIGEDIMLWGASIQKRAANQTHPWHSDIESASAKGKTVSVWIGLKGVDLRSSLAYVPYSHAFGFTVQEVSAKHNKSRHKTTRDDIAQWAKEQDERSTLIVPEMGGGDALFFDGNIWHGSQNKNQEIRFALLLQYATPESAIRIANLNYLDWPFKQFNQPRPACIMLRGSDHYGVNRIVSAPISNNGGTKLQLTNRIYPLDLPLTPDAQKGWKPYPIFHGSTGNINDMSCHISVLNQHKCPHEPHNHKEEELLILLKGEAQLNLPDLDEPKRIITEGEFVYYPAWFHHTLTTTTQEPANYLMFRWYEKSLKRSSKEAFGHFKLNDYFNEIKTEKGFNAKKVFEGPTECLRKLHCHISVLKPSGGYDAHADAYDVAIIILEGEVETIGERIGPHGVIFYPAGEPHGMHNPGNIEAKYIVFEFHGSQSPQEVENPYLRPFHQKLLDPQNWKRKAKQIIKKFKK